jgi:hypothetical protein
MVASAGPRSAAAPVGGSGGGPSARAMAEGRKGRDHGGGRREGRGAGVRQLSESGAASVVEQGRASLAVVRRRLGTGEGGNEDALGFCGLYM